MVMVLYIYTMQLYFHIDQGRLQMQTNSVTLFLLFVYPCQLNNCQKIMLFQRDLTRGFFPFNSCLNCQGGLGSKVNELVQQTRWQFLLCFFVVISRMVFLIFIFSQCFQCGKCQMKRVKESSVNFNWVGRNQFSTLIEETTLKRKTK